MAKKYQSDEFPNGVRVEGLVVNGTKILLMHRRKKGNEYWVLPGGGWEIGESEKEGVVRELQEETSLTVEVVRLVYVMKVRGDSKKMVYECRYLGGEAKLHEKSGEKAKMERNPENFFQPEWIEIEKMREMKVYLLEFRDWFLGNWRNWESVVGVREEIVDLDRLRG